MWLHPFILGILPCISEDMMGITYVEKPYINIEEIAELPQYNIYFEFE